MDDYTELDTNTFDFDTRLQELQQNPTPILEELVDHIIFPIFVNAFAMTDKSVMLGPSDELKLDIALRNQGRDHLLALLRLTLATFKPIKTEEE